MIDFRDIEVKSGNQSFVITLVIGLLSLFILLISFSFDLKKNKTQPIEIAMNFGNTDLGQGKEEPAATENSLATSTPSISQQVESTSQSAPSTLQSITQNTTENRPIATKQKPKSTQSKQTTRANSQKSKPKGNQQANDALSNILGGKGKSNSNGQGNNNTSGNIGDPKGGDSNGNGIGEDWKSKIPEPQQHNCSASGVIMVEIIVNASGGIKSATPGVKGSTSADICLKARAKELVLKYVRANPGTDGRKGIYKVNLR